MTTSTSLIVTIFSELCYSCIAARASVSFAMYVVLARRSTDWRTHKGLGRHADSVGLWLFGFAMMLVGNVHLVCPCQPDRRDQATFGWFVPVSRFWPTSCRPVCRPGYVVWRTGIRLSAYGRVGCANRFGEPELPLPKKHRVAA